MSYILEALKKSDQQRQRSAAPTLPAATVTVTPTRQPVYYGLLAVVLLSSGIAIGWLQPWQMEPSHRATPAISPTQVSHKAAPLQDSTEIAEKTAPQLKTAQALPVADSTHEVHPAPGVGAIKAAIPAQPRTGIPGTTATSPMPEANPADAAQERAIAINELPASIQQEIPAMDVQFHAYSTIPANRLVGINSRTLHEGESLAAGLRLEQITLDGVIFSYKGYRFQRGIR